MSSKAVMLLGCQVNANAKPFCMAISQHRSHKIFTGEKKPSANEPKVKYYRIYKKIIHHKQEQADTKHWRISILKT